MWANLSAARGEKGFSQGFEKMGRVELEGNMAGRDREIRRKDGGFKCGLL